MLYLLLSDQQMSAQGCQSQNARDSKLPQTIWAQPLIERLLECCAHDNAQEEHKDEQSSMSAGLQCSGRA